MKTCTNCGVPLVPGYKRDGGNWPPSMQASCTHKCSSCISAQAPAPKPGDWSRLLREYREEFFARYGDKCACCGESNKRFLTVGHVEEGTVDNRLTTLPFLRQLKKQGWPATVQTECFNCNCGKALNKGVCPHKEVT